MSVSLAHGRDLRWFRPRTRPVADGRVRLCEYPRTQSQPATRSCHYSKARLCALSLGGFGDRAGASSFALHGYLGVWVTCRCIKRQCRGHDYRGANRQQISLVGIVDEMAGVIPSAAEFRFDESARVEARIPPAAASQTANRQSLYLRVMAALIDPDLTGGGPVHVCT